MGSEGPTRQCCSVAGHLGGSQDGAVGLGGAAWAGLRPEAGPGAPAGACDQSQGLDCKLGCRKQALGGGGRQSCCSLGLPRGIGSGSGWHQWGTRGGACQDRDWGTGSEHWEIDFTKVTALRLIVAALTCSGPSPGLIGASEFAWELCGHQSREPEAEATPGSRAGCSLDSICYLAFSSIKAPLSSPHLLISVPPTLVLDLPLRILLTALCVIFPESFLGEAGLGHH